MYAHTWAPGSNRHLDTTFELLRSMYVNLNDHDLVSNYNKEHFEQCIALTIAYDGNDHPQFCGSILARDCWPQGAYRIMNRFWKVNREKDGIKHIHPLSALLVNSQLDWLQNNTDHKLAFISREGLTWRKFALRDFSVRYDLHFDTVEKKFLTCGNSDCDSCWQHIIYRGDHNLLNTWICK